MGILDIFKGSSKTPGSDPPRVRDGATRQGPDGTTPDQAITFSGGEHLEAVAASYAHIARLHGQRGADWEFESQETIKRHDKVLDAITVKTHRGNRTYYFDVSRFFPQRRTPSQTGVSSSQRTAEIYDFVTKEMHRLARDLRDRRSGQEYVELTPLQLFRLTVCWLATALWKAHPANLLSVRYGELLVALGTIAQQLPGDRKPSESDIHDLFYTARRLMLDGGSMAGTPSTPAGYSWDYAKLIFGDSGLKSDMSKTNPLVAKHHAHFFMYLTGEEIPIDLLDDPF